MLPALQFQTSQQRHDQQEDVNCCTKPTHITKHNANKINLYFTKNKTKSGILALSPHIK